MAACAAIARGDDDLSWLYPAEETAYELAPRLTEIEALAPELHRVLADGTWDTYSVTDKVAFVEKLISVVEKTVDPEHEAALRDDLAEMDSMRREMLKAGDDDEVAKWDRATTRGTLGRLDRLERKLRVKRLRDEGDHDAAEKEAQKDAEMLERLWEKYPEHFRKDIDPSTLFGTGPTWNALTLKSTAGSSSSSM